MKDLNKELLLDAVEQAANDKRHETLTISHSIFSKPELAFQEFFAADLLENVLRENGFMTVRGEGILQTAIRAESAARKGLRVGFISEYDALPIGHACGHNLIAASGVMAAIVFDEIVQRYDLPAQTVFLGTPAEEGGGGKIKMLDAGMFHDIDYVMMIHPCDSTMVEDWSLAGQGITLKYYGKGAHCAASPWLGKNALAAALETVNMVNAWRSQCKDFTRVFPNITHGGEATNVIPDYAEVKYNIRHEDRQYQQELVHIVEKCAFCASEAFNVQLETERSIAYAPIHNDKKLEEHMQAAFERLGETVIPRYRDHGIGSTDMGNVSWAMPAIHGHLFLANVNTHTEQFREAAGGEMGDIYVMKAVKAMAMTGIGLVTDPEIMRKINA